MKIITTNIFHCENEDEYFEAMAAIDDELADIEDMNNICNDSMHMEVHEYKDELKIKTITTYIR